MAIGSGLGSSLGLAAESTYGTYVAAARHLAGTFNVKHLHDTVPVSGVAAGRPAPPDEVVTQVQGTAKFEGQFMNKQMGLLLSQLTGSTTSPVQQGATTAYLQTHAWGDNLGKSMSVQCGIADTTGTVRPYTALGSKITQAEFSCAAGEALTVSVDWDCREITEAQTLVAPSYQSGNLPFKFNQMAVKLGTYGAEASVQGVKGMSVTFSRSQDVGRFYAGNGGKKSEPVWNDFVAISGTLEVDFVNKADFVDRYVGHTSTSLVIEFVGPVIADAYNETFRIKVPKVYFSGDVPEVGGPDVNKASIPFSAFWDPTNGVSTLEYMSTDTTV